MLGATRSQYIDIGKRSNNAGARFGTNPSGPGDFFAYPRYAVLV
jgi:hypothetical protein